MNLKKVFFAAGLIAIAALAVWLVRRPKGELRTAFTTPKSASTARASPVAAAPASTNAVAPSYPWRKAKRRVSEFGKNDRATFLKNFEERFKPALRKWCAAFEGHVPFSPDAVTASTLVERIGMNESYSEYIFVVDGITLGIQDNKGVARVDYLNAPQQTRKMTMLPDGSQVPILTNPVTKQEMMRMLKAEGGTMFPEHEIRMTPSALSGSLNGGVFVHVGGDPENSASWKYDIVIDPDGMLAFYLTGL